MRSSRAIELLASAGWLSEAVETADRIGILWTPEGAQKALLIHEISRRFGLIDRESAEYFCICVQQVNESTLSGVRTLTAEFWEECRSELGASLNEMANVALTIRASNTDHSLLGSNEDLENVS